MLGSAVLHVLWNAAVRRAGGSLRFVWWLTLGAGLTGAIAAGHSLLDPALWRVYPLLILTIAFNGTYYLTLGRAYGRGDLSWVYPISRGFAVAVTAPLAWLILREPLSPMAWGGLLVVLAGIGAMPRPGVGTGAGDWLRPMVVGALVAGYTLVDGTAVRVAPPLAYAAVQHLGSALVVAPAAWWGVPGPQEPVRRTRWIALGAGAVSLVSYVLMLYAYRLAPLGLALALRQVAPSLAALTGALLLHERVPIRRSLATAAIVAGAVLMVLV